MSDPRIPSPELGDPEAGDAELCALIRKHTTDSEIGRRAFGELYARHRQAALHFALRLTHDRARAEDAVAEAFAKIWRAWGNGAGPRESFKSYLMTAVRSESFRLSATTSATTTVPPDVLTFLAGSAPRDHASEVSERDQLARAFKSLPETWQTAITMIDIDGTPTATAAEAMELSPNSFNSLLHRAREGLRTAYLQEHVEPVQPTCEEYSSELARYVRNKLGHKQGASVETHLRHCLYCRHQSLRLRKLNTVLGAWLTPAVLATALVESEHFPATPVPPGDGVDAAGSGIVDAQPAQAQPVGADAGAWAHAGSAASGSGTTGAGAAGAGAAGAGAAGAGVAHLSLATALKVAAGSVLASAVFAAGTMGLNRGEDVPESQGPPSASTAPLPVTTTVPDRTDDDDGESGNESEPVPQPEAVAPADVPAAAPPAPDDDPPAAEPSAPEAPAPSADSDSTAGSDSTSGSEATRGADGGGADGPDSGDADSGDADSGDADSGDADSGPGPDAEAESASASDEDSTADMMGSEDADDTEDADSGPEDADTSADVDASTDPDTSADVDASTDPDTSADVDNSTDPDTSADVDNSTDPDTSADVDNSTDSDASADPDSSAETDGTDDAEGTADGSWHCHYHEDWILCHWV